MLTAVQTLVLAFAALLGAMAGFQIGHVAGVGDGRADLLTEQADARRVVEQERAADDARLDALSDRALCIRSLRARGLPVDACAGLRGLPAERP